MKNALPILLAAVLLSACTRTDAVRMNDSSRYAPSQYVDVLNEPPSQPYEVISLLESRGAIGQSLPALLESMRDRAKGLGADAIIPTEKRSEYQAPGFIYNSLIGGYISLPGGEVPILRGYAIIYEVNRTARASAYREPGVSGGAAVNALPFALGGYGAEAWAGKGQFRGVGEVYSLDSPQAFTRDGFTDGQVEYAIRVTGDYFFLNDLDGPYFSTGLEYSSNSVGYENSTARGEWDSFFFSGGAGYLLPLGRNFHLDARIALNARLTGESEVNVGGRRFAPDDATLAAFIGIGVNF